MSVFTANSREQSLIQNEGHSESLIQDKDLDTDLTHEEPANVETKIN